MMMSILIWMMELAPMTVGIPANTEHPPMTPSANHAQFHAKTATVRLTVLCVFLAIIFTRIITLVLPFAWLMEVFIHRALMLEMILICIVESVWLRVVTIALTMFVLRALMAMCMWLGLVRPAAPIILMKRITIVLIVMRVVMGAMEPLMVIVLPAQMAII